MAAIKLLRIQFLVIKKQIKIIIETEIPSISLSDICPSNIKNI